MKSCDFCTKEFIQMWRIENSPSELKNLMGEGDLWVAYIPRDYFKDMSVDLKDGARVLIRKDLKKYNGIIVTSKVEPKFEL